MFEYVSHVLPLSRSDTHAYSHSGAKSNSRTDTHAKSCANTDAHS